ncbi:MAG: ROK family transcriptional regulator [Christensenellaceae bacterium]|nr:ROK family transcriptional regulator [Christensenellaceae bacterium]
MDKHKMAMHNKQNVMRCISDHGPINRSAIAQMVGLSIPTVMEITDQLIEHGMVVTGMKKAKGQGKRPELLRVCGEHYRFIGVDIGRTTVRIVLTGLDRGIISTVKYATEGVQRERRFVERICAEIVSLTQRSGVDMDGIVGVCVAMPGLIERETGRVIFSPNFGWEDVPLQAWMNEILPMEVIVENANRVQASWEVSRDQENNNLTVLCIGLGYGIGGGLLQNGKLYYGASGTSGEIGHLLVCHDADAQCSCGNVGCLEAVASGAALARKARELVHQGKGEALARMCDGEISRLDAKMVFEAAKAGDVHAQLIIDQTAEYIGIALAASINLLDPDRIYLCGGMMKNDSEFLKKIKASTLRKQMHNAGRGVEILQGDPDEWNVARGAAQVVPLYSWSKDSLAFMR